MERDFYRERLQSRFGLDVRVPAADERVQIDRIIFDELVHGELRDESRAFYHEVIGRLARDGAQGVILGCTEIGLLVRPKESPLPVYDTAVLHAKAAVDWLLQ